MQHYLSLEAVSLDNGWLTIGVFDGVHRGHQEIIRQLTAGAHANGAPAVVFTFSPHPALVLGGVEIKCLTTPDERASLLAGLGVDVVITHPFDKQTAASAPKNSWRRSSNISACESCWWDMTFPWAATAPGILPV